MPKRFERHARTAWEWGTPGSRRDELARAVSEPAGKAPGKKDRNLCKAAHWKAPHQPVLRMQEYGWRRTTGCRWVISWRSKDDEPAWHCAHEEFCGGCSKILRTVIGDEECPAFHPVTDDERAAIEAERAEHEVRVAAVRERTHWRPKPAITGKQGFRRKRDE